MSNNLLNRFLNRASWLVFAVWLCLAPGPVGMSKFGHLPLSSRLAVIPRVSHKHKPRRTRSERVLQPPHVIKRQRTCRVRQHKAGVDRRTNLPPKFERDALATRRVFPCPPNLQCFLRPHLSRFSDQTGIPQNLGLASNLSPISSWN